MIGEALIVLVVGLLAGSAGMWFGIVVLAPRLGRRIDRADAAAREPDDRTE